MYGKPENDSYEQIRNLFFQRLLSLWVLLCMGNGVLLCHCFPSFSAFLLKLSLAQVNIPIAVPIWLMIFPMMRKIDFTSIKNVFRKPKPLILTWIINWAIKPFTMLGTTYLFLHVFYSGIIPADLANDYLIGAVLLGAAPCTTMVFVWSALANGNPAYTLLQVATNDLILPVAYVPMVGICLGIGGFSIPWLTLLFSIVFFILIPLVLATLVRFLVVRKAGVSYLEEKGIPKFSPFTTAGLLLMLVLLFTMQSKLILENPVHILFIAVPLILQTFLIYGQSLLGGKLLKLPYEVAAPASFIGPSNFFELAVAVATSLCPANPGVALATTVGVLTEVPTMLILVSITKPLKRLFS